MPFGIQPARNLYEGYGAYRRKRRAPVKRSMALRRRAPVVKGMGAYRSSNLKLFEGQDPPTIANSGRANIIRHREYIADVNGTVAFTNVAFPINPGLVTSFPWISNLAANYEEWRIRGMVYEFKSLSATAVASTNTALGSVIMATQYNATASAFLSKQQMENYEGCTAANPSQSFMHPIECAKGKSPTQVLYIRSVAVPSGQDPRLYDWGIFNIATAGMQAASVIGELWCSYEIELLKPKLTRTLNVLTETDSFHGETSVDTTNYLGTAVTFGSNNSIGGTFGTSGGASGAVYKFPANYAEGRYVCIYRADVASGAVTAPTYTVANGSVVSNGTFRGPANGNTATLMVSGIVLDITAPSCTITLSGATLGAGATHADFAITEWNSNVAPFFT